MLALTLWSDYTREQVHSIFSPDTKFTPQSGTWGLQGIVRVPSRLGDWVFFVTLGRQQGDHVFDESVTTDGVLSWQSQPAQRLEDRPIQELIEHDDRINSIRLFLRTTRQGAYTYLGELGYLTHDLSRERPVHFQWQLLDWPAPSEALSRIGLSLIDTPMSSAPSDIESQESGLVLVDPPNPREPRRGVATDTFRKVKAPDYAARDAHNRTLGRKGELLVLAHERGRLVAAGREDLAERVVHTSIVEGDGAGYDIRSYEEDGQPRLIEVKTTAGEADTDFFISPNELSCSARNANHYYLFRLYRYDEKADAARSYVLRGDLNQQLSLMPTAFRAALAASSDS